MGDTTWGGMPIEITRYRVKWNNSHQARAPEKYLAVWTYRLSHCPLLGRRNAFVRRTRDGRPPGIECIWWHSDLDCRSCSAVSSRKPRRCRIASAPPTSARIKETLDLLTLSLEAHEPRAEYWRTLLDSRGYNLSEQVQVPVRLQQLLAKQNVPEKLMFTWLNEFEVRLHDHYESLEGSASCGPQGEYFLRVLKDQRDLVEKTNQFSQTLTSIMPTIWSF